MSSHKNQDVWFLFKKKKTAYLYPYSYTIMMIEVGSSALEFITDPSWLTMLH